jgi:hypothetical protein
MMDTVSSLEIIRFLVGTAGAIVCARSRGNAESRLPQLRAVPLGETVRARFDRTQRLERIELVSRIQTILLVIHVGFAFNAGVNFFYPSSSLEQFNVMTSNVLQVLAPIGLIVVSELITHHMVKSAQMTDLANQQHRDASHRLRTSHLYGGVLVPLEDDEDDDSEQAEPKTQGDGPTEPSREGSPRA